MVSHLSWKTRAGIAWMGEAHGQAKLNAKGYNPSAIAVVLISMVSGANQPEVKEVREKHEAELFAIEGVYGVSVDEAKNEIIVYIEKPEISKKVPKEIEGFPVRHEVIGKIQVLNLVAEN